MKRIAFLLALLLALSCLAGCGGQQTQPEAAGTPETETPEIPATAEPEPAAEPEPEPTAEPEPEVTEEPAPTPDPNTEPVLLEDFTVRCCDGTDFTLSKALEDHELVLINLWATWCGPCRREFPFLQEAWSQNSDKVAVIALSVEPDDTDEVLRNFAAANGLSFPMANVAGTGLDRFVPGYIPVTLYVDRSSRIAAMTGGAESSTEAFLEHFARYTGPDYDPMVCRYTVRIIDENYAPVEGVVINFCTDTACTPVTTDGEGLAVFTGMRYRYHIQVIKIPEGYEFVDPDTYTAEPYDQNYLIMLRRAG